MRLILIIATILTLGIVSLHANSSRSASFYLNAPEKYENEKITLYVTSVTRQGAIEDFEGVVYSAYTMSRDEDDTSYISVLVPKDKAESFARKYGSDFKYQNGKIRKLPMRGVLRQLNDTWFLEYGLD